MLHHSEGVPRNAHGQERRAISEIQNSVMPKQVVVVRRKMIEKAQMISSAMDRKRDVAQLVRVVVEVEEVECAVVWLVVAVAASRSDWARADASNARMWMAGQACTRNNNVLTGSASPTDALTASIIQYRADVDHRVKSGGTPLRVGAKFTSEILSGTLRQFRDGFA